MSNGLNKKYLGLILGALLLILIFVFFFSKKSPQNYQQSNQDQSNSTPAPEPTPAPTGKLTYDQAVAKYKYRYQFVSCHANPGSMVVAKNDPVMFDNRDNRAHLIKIGSINSFNIGALDYTIYYPSIKGTYNITCDGGGSAILKVE
jgi:hypothetical protein